MFVIRILVAERVEACRVSVNVTVGGVCMDRGRVRNIKLYVFQSNQDSDSQACSVGGEEYSDSVQD